MQVRSILLGFILAFSVANATASDLHKPNRFDCIQAYVTNSYVAQVIKYLARPFDWLLGKFLRINHGNASAEYQKIGKQAQIDLGIHPKLTIPIRKTNNPEVGGCVLPTTGGIYANENHSLYKAYGLKNQTLRHEATHIKYADGPSTLFAAYAAMELISAGNAIAKTFCKEHDTAIDWISTVIGLLSVYKIVKNYNYYCEHRADTEGLYATNCFVCTSNRKKHEQERKQDITKFGYLSVKEIEQIEHHLKAHNRICSYHVNEKKYKFFDNKKEVFAPFKQIKEIKNILPKLSYYTNFKSCT